MKIALIGATGFVGSYILAEALNRGHWVTALVRYPEKLPQYSNLIGKKMDVFDQAKLAQSIAGHDAVISAFNSFGEGLPDSKAMRLQVEGIKLIIHAVKTAKLKRLLVVGGAGSLDVRPKLQLVDTAEFPEEYKSMALAMREVLHILEAESSLDWTFLSPSALLQPGERTGKFRLGKNQLLSNEKGESKISTQDYAVAMLDELENPEHIRQRFTVGY
ncbi:NAD(P)-dependent oxidoreductase [Aquicella lusitana]|jgi:Putative NADH-flavin reductase|uniref:NAD(P)-binding domain-containing protein n=1 Tax=Aquicella lusitana TaxID=254246 RepID=A0A370G821_9COXI|nr:NAD(P)-dependent oxidoreductase [Aquicella lusitana]RDI39942.1 hypothetical protein C8D86_1253 [Aquicella lusitana]VVC74545.1 3 beta-hydroxysteroid dehydrogenase/Delta 5-->4-isomerase [Aquicella lusitana]